MIKNRVIALIFFLFYLVTTIVASTGKSLVVQSINGKTVRFLLAYLPELTFSNHTFLVTDNRQTVSFKIDDIIQYYFESENADIMSVGSQADLQLYYNTDGNVLIGGFAQPIHIRIFSVNGLEYSDYVSIINNTAVVPLSSLKKGVYIISINNQQIKVYKK